MTTQLHICINDHLSIMNQARSQGIISLSQKLIISNVKNLSPVTLKQVSIP